MESSALSEGVGLESSALSEGVGLESSALSEGVGLESSALSEGVGLESSALSEGVGLESLTLSEDVGLESSALTEGVGLEGRSGVSCSKVLERYLRRTTRGTSILVFKVTTALASFAGRKSDMTETLGLFEAVLLFAIAKAVTTPSAVTSAGPSTADLFSVTYSSVEPDGGSPVDGFPDGGFPVDDSMAGSLAGYFNFKELKW